MCIWGELNRSYENKSKSIQPLIPDRLYLQNIENTSGRIHTVYLSYIVLVIYCCITTIPKLSGWKQQPFIYAHKSMGQLRDFAELDQYCLILADLAPVIGKSIGCWLV